MHDRPLEITEMALRVKYRIRWQLFLGGALFFWGLPVILWIVSFGFANLPFDGSLKMLSQYAAVLFGSLLWLGAGRMYLFEYLPYKNARKMNSGSPDMRRR